MSQQQLRRRTLLNHGAWTALAALAASAGARASTPTAAGAMRMGPAQAFSWDGLVQRAQQLAGQPHKREATLPAAVIERIDYDQHGRLRFKSEYALFRDGPGAFALTFFHLGRFFPTPVHMHVLQQQQKQWHARELLYDADYFQMPPDSPARELPDGAGFAGFRFQESRQGSGAADALDWRTHDWVAFLGASYFRAIGALNQYGLSARGIAIDVAVPGREEEFPLFTHFWFEPPAEGSRRVTVYALLDGPSVTGAFRFHMQRDKAVTMDVEQRLFLRRDVARLGLAPLTSMYWYSETQGARGADWRPEVHDSDGLALWTGGGERLWRPLNNPAATRASQFNDRSPKGFGLMQRDRDFNHYQDGVHYERRPSLWVEPVGDWGEGSVQLIEIPTDDEIHDNIVACWVPAAPARRGQQLGLRYRLHWVDDEPFVPLLARCGATRVGRGGQPGTPRPQGVHKFMVEFSGGELARLPFGVKPEPVLSAASGRFGDVFAEPVPNGVAGHWRAQFDYIPAEGQTEAVDLRLYLREGRRTLSETWLYQLAPMPA
ncbi:glucan biosynthesis protein D [Xenophilus arseniciresistens]|uniref:Glucan biosynthesis protein D n=1 Tax=Xenophilus arseniciresistens TaxID=1283306 RepID=A0AAE3N6S6_9BURK|nr:glucan biosynthesis protein D [Xenophilus arseniciresistens]MDA7417000.1 glucan biosynthesis protein D [Xenophilus arseniciresistens]